MTSPYKAALRKKKFEGLQHQEPVNPAMDQEEMTQAASNGDYAPEITDDPEMELAPEMAQLGQMDSEMQINDEEAMQFASDAQATPGIQDLTAEEVFGVSSPTGHGGLREKAMQQSMKKKRF
jgi:hypothetical protein